MQVPKESNQQGVSSILSRRCPVCSRKLVRKGISYPHGGILRALVCEFHGDPLLCSHEWSNWRPPADGQPWRECERCPVRQTWEEANGL